MPWAQTVLVAYVFVFQVASDTTMFTSSLDNFMHSAGVTGGSGLGTIARNLQESDLPQDQKRNSVTDVFYINIVQQVGYHLEFI